MGNNMKRGKDYIGVGCGAFIIDESETKILLLRRKKDPEAGFWSIPGGAVEFGETFEAAVSREILEETGLKIKVLSLLSLTDHIFPENGVHWITPSYLATVVGGELQNLEPEKQDALEWFDLNHLPEKLAMPTLNALRRYQEIKKR